jgi:hypothetical protein|tara:strand:- start:26 stop:226 length:201 start_codon:yes stop_codon:yes gene_type:complete
MSAEKETRADLASWVAHLSRQYAAIVDEFGTGTRPSWVSAELAGLGSSIDNARTRLKDLEASTIQS